MNSFAAPPHTSRWLSKQLLSASKSGTNMEIFFYFLSVCKNSKDLWERICGKTRKVGKEFTSSISSLVIMSGGDIMALSPANRTSIPTDVHWPEKYAPTPTNATSLKGHSPSFITRKITSFWTKWLPWAKYQLLVTTIGSKEYNCRNLHTKQLDLCASLTGYCIHQHWLTWLTKGELSF